MDIVAKEKKSQKRGLITKTWERCKSIGRGGINGPALDDSSTHRGLTKKSKSWHGRNDGVGVLGRSPGPDCGRPDASDDKIGRKNKHKHQVAPEGCFSVYVGPQKQRFVIRTEYANHPLFKMLLEEAENEYGYNCTGPLELPCDCDVFCRILVEMDSDDSVSGPRRGCGFVTHGGIGGHGPYRLLSPSRMMAINQF